jgi:tetratricopeptide (TPR) repeat protein
MLLQRNLRKSFASGLGRRSLFSSLSLPVDHLRGLGSPAEHQQTTGESLSDGSNAYDDWESPSMTVPVRKRRNLEAHHAALTLFDKSPQSLRGAVQAMDPRLSWCLYKTLFNDAALAELEPQDHSGILAFAASHPHPNIAVLVCRRVMENMKQLNIPMDQRDYQYTLLSLVRARDLKSTVELYDTMVQHFPPDSRSTRLLLALYAVYGHSTPVQNTWRLLKEIPGALDNPDVWAVGIEAFGKTGQFDEALNLFNKYKTRVQTETRPIPQFKTLDRKPFEAMIRMYGLRGKFQEAESLFTEVTTKLFDGPDVYTFDAILEASQATRQMDRLEFYWKKLLEFTSKNAQLFESHRASGSKRLALPIANRDTQPLHASSIRLMGLYRERKDLDKLLALYDSILVMSLPPLEALETVIWAFLESKDMDAEAVEWYQRMLERWYQPSELLVNTMAYVQSKTAGQRDPSSSKSGSRQQQSNKWRWRPLAKTDLS